MRKENGARSSNREIEFPSKYVNLKFLSSFYSRKEERGRCTAVPWNNPPETYFPRRLRPLNTTTSPFYNTILSSLDTDNLPKLENKNRGTIKRDTAQFKLTFTFSSSSFVRFFAFSIFHSLEPATRTKTTTILANHHPVDSLVNWKLSQDILLPGWKLGH